MANERLDIIIFGATGFTGKHAVQIAAQLAKEKQIKFGISGRRKQALEGVLKEFAPDIENVPIIVADLKDEESLKKMTEQAKILVNCCGPYRFYGEPVIKACIATHTHQIDVSGEPQYIEGIQLKYDKEAREAGIYIVNACGFDSIPCDLGVIFAQGKFDGEVNTIEAYMTSWVATEVDSAVIHYGTYESAIYGVTSYNELRRLRTKLYPEKLPPFQPQLVRRNLIHKTELGWATVFPGPDQSVVERTQRFFYDKYKQRPVQIQTYITYKSLFTALVTVIFAGVFAVLSRFQCGRSILQKYPAFFTYGYVSHEGPSRKVQENTHFKFTFIAKGWTEKLSISTDNHKDPPNKVLTTQVSGVDPAYDGTCTMLILAAMMILKESDKIPENAGVLTPGIAFGKTSLIEELNKKGIKFEILSSKEL
ncbi:saccharopine dehydrogenase-like oxidoreductase [Nomia melanderi]|uniref:saccharopine dehydrogenase-like oxidoreductase n=1 Tax=Nomia melanderi TaxID=2448451 RepID=UPI003FCD67F5